MNELYYFSTCIITPDNTIKGALHLDNIDYIAFNKEAIFIGEKMNRLDQSNHHVRLIKPIFLIFRELNDNKEV